MDARLGNCCSETDGSPYMPVGELGELHEFPIHKVDQRGELVEPDSHGNPREEPWKGQCLVSKERTNGGARREEQ